MLILTRNVGEKIIIGGDIEVVILEANGQVKLGLEAAREENIVRQELLEEP